MAEENVDQTAAKVDPQGAAPAEQAQAEKEGSATKSARKSPKTAQAAEASVFKELGGTGQRANDALNDIDLILDIPVQLTVELGRTKIAIKNLLQLAQGSVVELDGMAGEPMDVLVNGCLIAQGEVVVVNDKFGIRLTDIITPAERIRKLNR
ncbi:MAG: flagellar motor switch protein FliN [Herbaspirillum sp.]